MSLWLVRAGKHGEQEQGAIENNVVTIGWNDFPDLSNIKTRDDLRELYELVYPSAKKMAVANEVGQIWRFINEIQKGDLVALPLKAQSAISIGKIIGDYEYKKLTPNIMHIRRVKWLKTIPRSAFDQDLLYSLGACMTVCQISRNNAKNRVKNILQKKDILVGEKPVIVEEIIDIEQYARDQILNYIGQKFKGHNLSRIVEAILQAQGCNTIKSPPGPDGGVDILAAYGPLGYEHPRICVQVKSSTAPIDVRVLRELRGVMSKVGAEQGLLVAWGGFKDTTLKEARDAFFRIRLWDAGNLLEAIFKYYEKLDDELKAELPLKKIWALIVEE